MRVDISVRSVAQALNEALVALKRHKSTWTSRTPTHHESFMAGECDSDEHDDCLDCPRRKKVGAALF